MILMMLDHPMNKAGCTLFLSIAPNIGDREARSSTVQGLSSGHELMRVDLSQSQNEHSIRQGG